MHNSSRRIKMVSAIFNGRRRSSRLSTMVMDKHVTLHSLVFLILYKATYRNFREGIYFHFVLMGNYSLVFLKNNVNLVICSEVQYSMRIVRLPMLY